MLIRHIFDHSRIGLYFIFPQSTTNKIIRKLKLTVYYKKFSQKLSKLHDHNYTYIKAYNLHRVKYLQNQ